MDADSWVQGWIQNRGKTRDDGSEAWCWFNMPMALNSGSLIDPNWKHSAFAPLCVCKGAQLDKTTRKVYGIVEFMCSVFCYFINSHLRCNSLASWSVLLCVCMCQRSHAQSRCLVWLITLSLSVWEKKCCFSMKFVWWWEQIGVDHQQVYSMFTDVFIHTLKSRQVIQKPLAKITLSPVLQGWSFRVSHPAWLNEQHLVEAFCSRSSWIAQTVLQPRSGEQLFWVLKSWSIFVQTRTGLKVGCWTEVSQSWEDVRPVHF